MMSSKTVGAKLGSMKPSAGQRFAQNEPVAPAKEGPLLVLVAASHRRLEVGTGCVEKVLGGGGGVQHTV